MSGRRAMRGAAAAGGGAKTTKKTILVGRAGRAAMVVGMVVKQINESGTRFLLQTFGSKHPTANIKTCSAKHANETNQGGPVYYYTVRASTTIFDHCCCAYRRFTIGDVYLLVQRISIRGRANHGIFSTSSGKKKSWALQDSTLT